MPPFKPPQERREVTPPGRSREVEPDQSELKNQLESMMAGLESRLKIMVDDKLSTFASRIENKVSALSLRVKKMEDRIDKLERGHRSPGPQARSRSPLACYGCGNSGHFISQCPECGIKSVWFEDQKERIRVRIDAPTPTLEQQRSEPRSEEQWGEDKCETGRTSWDSRSCPASHRKDRPPQEVLNPNGLDPPHQPQKLVNTSGLDPPHKSQKVVNGLDPPDQQKHKEKPKTAVSDADTGMQHQEIASGGERSIICTGVRKVPAYIVREEVGNVSGDAIINTAAEITVISEVYRRAIPKPKLHGKHGINAGTIREAPHNERSLTYRNQRREDLRSPRNERSRTGGKRHRNTGSPYDERSRAYRVRESPVRANPRRPRERSHEGEDRVSF
ncbi:hypothetical protein PoB_001648900 [Plakobranchus ocellatus]|uniref:CCHC-type domain-containing protein n=1 Tax=Plakobranchus ocellatus TaxID=259542 RepID=A0AAV3Z3W0_9GAST|nr:hypothetical protein PoB_001648900 [Plakobranchus ocellatus]